MRLVLTIFLLLLGAITRADAPIVVATTPTLNARHVSPGPAEIVVRFDRPMKQGSWSFCGGGESFPEIVGTIRNTAPATVAMPVRLKPETTYSLSINCLNARGFASAAGFPAEPLPNDYKLIMARWQSLQPDGTPFEGIGLAPDVPIDGDFLNGDPVLEKALEMATGDHQPPSN